MTKATIPGTNTTCGQTGVACYTYDRNGNRTTKQVNAATTTYTYHPTDEVKDQTISGVTKTFAYNVYGSQTTAFDAANAVTTSAYDTAERLLTVTPPTGGAASYTYDALGRIATKTIGASVDTYSYLGSTKTAWQIVNTGGSGVTTKSAIDATGARTAVTGNALTGYTGFDLHGNTVLAENASKTITDALRYDAWGELIASTTSALPTPWRYQGRLDVGPDAANPLYDFGARAYRPLLGAFTSLDSYAGQAIDPLSMNRFLYAEANPSSFVDPDGHAGCKVAPKCLAGGKVIVPVGTSPEGGKGEKDPVFTSAPSNDYQTTLPPQGGTLDAQQIDLLSFGQLQAYLTQRGVDCDGAFANWYGCEDVGYATCSVVARAGGDVDCMEYSARPDARQDLTIDGLSATAALLVRFAPALLSWMQRNGEQELEQAPIVANRIRGLQFETSALRVLQAIKNGQPIPGLDRIGQLRNTIPDSISNGIMEFKDVKVLVDARGQISAMAELAQRAHQQFNIYLGPSFGGTIAPAVKTAVTAAGGAIWRLDPATGAVWKIFP